MSFTRLAHVCLHVKNLQRTMAYYHKLGLTDGFTFTRKDKDYGIYLKIGGETFLEIFEEPEKGAGTEGGIAHFCLQTENLDELMAHLDEQGVEYTKKELGADETWQIWLKDPDGNRVEVHRYTENSYQFKGGNVEATW
jgi:catechol 2,3-dioxygenase-like lactoylglutathione lyase family enzyme